MAANTPRDGTKTLRPAPARPDLDALMARARDALDALSPEAREAMLAEQRESFARGNIGIDRGPDARRTVSGGTPPTEADRLSPQEIVEVTTAMVGVHRFCKQHGANAELLATIDTVTKACRLAITGCAALRGANAEIARLKQALADRDKSLPWIAAVASDASTALEFIQHCGLGRRYHEFRRRALAHRELEDNT